MARGGIRKGAGRPPGDNGTRRVMVSMRLHPMDVQRLEVLARVHGITKTAVLTRLIRQARRGGLTWIGLD